VAVVRGVKVAVGVVLRTVPAVSMKRRSRPLVVLTYFALRPGVCSVYPFGGEEPANIPNTNVLPVLNRPCVRLCARVVCVVERALSVVR
jgi:hypothetical protein